jgi:hypothetical protein
MKPGRWVALQLDWYSKRHFFILYEVKKDLEGVAAVIVFKNPVHKKCVSNVMSKSMRSTLTSQGTIRVKF